MALNRWTNRSKLSAGHLNEGVDALNLILSQPDALVRKLGEGGRERRFDIIIGMTTDTGPNGEADGTGEVYWVKPQYILPADAIDAPITFNDEVPIQAGEGDDLPDTLAVTNLTEWVDGTHNLPTGTPVMVLPVYERKKSPQIRYVMSAGGTGGSSPVAVLHLTDVWPGSGLYQAVAGPGTGAVVYAAIDTITTSTDVTESMFTGGSGSNNIAIHLREIGGTGHKLTPGTGTNTICVLAIQHDVNSLDGKGIYFFGFTGQTKSGCPTVP
jgi:hypothetical protein